jgi:hypothetical protein
LLWLYAMPVWLMAAVIVTGTLVATALVYVGISLLPKERCLPILKAISPVTLTPLAVVFGLLTGFLATNVWQNFDKARTLVSREANELRRVLLLTAEVPGPLARSVRAAVHAHVRSVAEEEWPAMRVRELVQTPAVHLNRAVGLLLEFEPRSGGERIVQQEATRAIAEALETRRQRLLQSQLSIAPVSWGVILFLAFLLLLTIAFVHADSRGTQAVTMTIFALSVAACLILLVSHDHPFGGEVSISPGPLLQITETPRG